MIDVCAVCRYLKHNKAIVTQEEGQNSWKQNSSKNIRGWKRNNLNVIIHYSFTFFGRYSLFISIFFQLFIHFRSQRELNAYKTQLRGLRCFIIKLGSH